MNEGKITKVPLEDNDPFSEAAVVEVPVLLESSLLPVLEAAALDQGRTAGALIRRLIRDFLDHSPSDSPTAGDDVDAPRPQDAIA